MNEVEVVGRKCESPVQVVNLQSVTLATALPETTRPRSRSIMLMVLQRREDSGGEMTCIGGCSSPLNVLLERLKGEWRRSTHLEPQVIRHIVWAHVRGNVYTNDLGR